MKRPHRCGASTQQKDFLKLAGPWLLRDAPLVIDEWSPERLHDITIIYLPLKTGRGEIRGGGKGKLHYSSASSTGNF
jgi:hypothetical protein